uniref:Uncharacterized protein n=1 Tax=Prevotella sp. GTC17259 TaxID=3236795 RepID=A0AB33J0K8_9BACT
MKSSYTNSTVVVRMICAIVFLLFTFLYLYSFQADVLAVAQHVLSKGQTHYNREVGAVLITSVLWLIQLGIYFWTKLDGKVHALTYFPSLLILTVITDISPSIDCGLSLGGWVYALPILVVLYVGIVWLILQMQLPDVVKTPHGLFSKDMWVNLLTMACMIFFVGLFANHDDVFHYRVQAEQAMLEGDYQKALKIGWGAYATDSSLTLIRMTALTETGQLGEKLFEYPLVGGTMAMLPDGVTTKFMMYPEKRLYQSLGGWFRQYMSPSRYFQYMSRHHKVNKKLEDYRLCAYLIDGKLDLFVKTLKLRRDSLTNLPKHYREALVLYNHQHANPLIVYHNNVLDADFEDFESLQNKSKNPLERYSMLRDSYGNTYWFWYYYRNRIPQS